VKHHRREREGRAKPKGKQMKSQFQLTSSPASHAYSRSNQLLCQIKPGEKLKRVFLAEKTLPFRSASECV
jgi:hypothetical protein